MRTISSPYSVLTAAATTFFAAVALLSPVHFLSGEAVAQNLQVSASPVGQVAVNAGETISFDFSVRNVGVFAAINTSLVVTLPTGISHVANNGSCDVSNPAVVSCPLGNVGGLSQTDRRITLQVADNFLGTASGGFLNFSATATANGNPPANTLLGSTPVTESADLQVSNYATVTSVLAGQSFDYVIYVDNFGPSTSRQVTISDTLLGSNSVTVNACAFSVSQGGGAITQFTCSTGSIGSAQFGANIGTFGTNFLRSLQLDGSGAVVGRLRARFTVTALQDMTLNADVRVISQTPDANPSNNQVNAPVVTVEGVADLSLGVVASGEVQPPGSSVLPFNLLSGDAFPDPAFGVSNVAVTAGRRVRFAYTVTNSGPSNALGATLTSQLPAGTRVVPGSLLVTDGDGAPASGSCQFGTPGNPADRMTCGLGNIPSSTTDGANVRVISVDVAVDQDLSVNTLLTNNVALASNTVDTDNSDNLGAGLVVVSPLIGVSDCSVGGPYTNVVCGSGSAALTLNGFGYALPDTGTLDLQWTTTCPGASFNDSTVASPIMNFTTANPDSSPVSCQVDLSVQNAFASSTCSGVVNVVDCSVDCNGLLAGTAEFDRCGVCEGDGKSCLGCVDQDLSSDIFTLSSNTLAIRRATLNVAKLVTSESARKAIERQARSTFRQNLRLISQLPTQARTCTNDTFCVQTSNVSLFDGTNAGLQTALKGLQRGVKRLRAETGDRRAGHRLLRKGNTALAIGQAALLNVPVTTSSCD